MCRIVHVFYGIFPSPTKLLQYATRGTAVWYTRVDVGSRQIASRFAAARQSYDQIVVSEISFASCLL